MVVNWTIYLGFPRQSCSHLFHLYRLIVRYVTILNRLNSLDPQKK